MCLLQIAQNNNCKHCKVGQGCESSANGVKEQENRRLVCLINDRKGEVRKEISRGEKE